MRMVEAGRALCVTGNHELKLRQKLAGADIPVAHGLDRSLAELDASTPDFRQEVRRFLDGLGSHYVLDHGRLVVAHAGLREDLQGRDSADVLAFATVAETVGDNGTWTVSGAVRLGGGLCRPRRRRLRSHAGARALWVNRTINIDTGCVLGNRLTALRWPEEQLVAVAARRPYAMPTRPLRDERSRSIPDSA